MKPIYLNNAATSFPKPESVNKAVIEYIQSLPFHSKRAGYKFHPQDPIETARVNIAKFFNIANPNRLIFTSGATESLSLAIFGLDLTGKHVVTTAIEHNSVLRPLKTLEREEKITLTVVPCNSYG